MLLAYTTMLLRYFRQPQEDWDVSLADKEELVHLKLSGAITWAHVHYCLLLTIAPSGWLNCLHFKNKANRETKHPAPATH